MKIDIGTDGKILGTKRVSPNGQVSGFSEYAGREVLVILPGDSTPIVRRDVSDVLAEAHDVWGEAQDLVREQMKLAFRQYKDLKRRFATPEQATQVFLSLRPADTIRGLVDKADQWIKEQANALDARVQRAPKRSKPKRK